MGVIGKDLILPQGTQHVPTERLSSLCLHTSGDGRRVPPGSPWVVTALINFFPRQTKSLWTEIESDAFSAELVKTTGWSTGMLPCAI